MIGSIRVSYPFLNTARINSNVDCSKVPLGDLAFSLLNICDGFTD
jgi:hypothetical protein